MKYYVIFLILLLSVVSCVSAAPTTQAATMVGNNNATLSGSGSSQSVAWFQWGMQSGRTWAHTPNQTVIGGSFSFTMKGMPLVGSTEYYFKACDSTGCGSEQSFTTLVVTPLPTTTFGIFAQNITESGMDPAMSFWDAMQPYTAVSGNTIFFGLIFAMIFIGMWLRTRGTTTGTMFGMICIGLFASTAVGLQVGLPPEFLAVGQALLYMSLTGAILVFTFK